VEPPAAVWARARPRSDPLEGDSLAPPVWLGTRDLVALWRGVGDLHRDVDFRSSVARSGNCRIHGVVWALDAQHYFSDFAGRRTRAWQSRAPLDDAPLDARHRCRQVARHISRRQAPRPVAGRTRFLHGAALRVGRGGHEHSLDRRPRGWRRSVVDSDNTYATR
jgi:hypothetical protein